jgi:hypothetical protein
LFAVIKRIVVKASTLLTRVVRAAWNDAKLMLNKLDWELTELKAPGIKRAGNALSARRAIRSLCDRPTGDGEKEREAATQSVKLPSESGSNSGCGRVCNKKEERSVLNEFVPNANCNDGPCKESETI